MSITDNVTNDLKIFIDDVLNQKIGIIHSRVETSVNNIISQMEEIKDVRDLSTYHLPEELEQKLLIAQTPPPPCT